MQKIKKFALLSAFALLGLNAQAQGDGLTDNHQITVVVPTIALLDIESGAAAAAKNFTATFTHSTEAGDNLTAPNNNTDLWLNYTSILATGVTTRKIQVKTSALVAGVNIAVVAGAATATGAGTKGTPAAVTLTTADQSIITAIGSAYTASGPLKGHQLTYSFTNPDANFAALRAISATPVTVTYTMSDN